MTSLPKCVYDIQTWGDSFILINGNVGFRQYVGMTEASAVRAYVRECDGKKSKGQSGFKAKRRRLRNMGVPRITK